MLLYCDSSSNALVTSSNALDALVPSSIFATDARVTSSDALVSLSLSLALAGMTRLGVVSQRCPTATSIMFI